jgi:hypothetical protein
VSGEVDVVLDGKRNSVEGQIALFRFPSLDLPNVAVKGICVEAMNPDRVIATALNFLENGVDYLPGRQFSRLITAA